MGMGMGIKQAAADWRQSDPLRMRAISEGGKVVIL
jgi:hypothetical protein